MMQTRTSFNNYGIAQRLRPCNLHYPLSLRINAIVDDHIAVAVVLVFAKLPNSEANQILVFWMTK
jgi:hypothetical protein